MTTPWLQTTSVEDSNERQRIHVHVTLVSKNTGPRVRLRLQRAKFAPNKEVRDGRRNEIGVPRRCQQ